MAPQLIFGTATFGMENSAIQDGETAVPILKALQQHGVPRLDSAARYPPLHPGRAEQIIGESGTFRHTFLVDTKVYADVTKPGNGELTREKIAASVEASLKWLGRSQINVLHMHRADPTTPLEEQVLGFKEQMDSKKILAWGASNMPFDQLEEMLELCEKNSWPKPVCYQGQYNLITRAAEDKLLPLLRKHGVSFNGYGPLAAGFLTGKFLRGDAAGTRLDSNTVVGGKIQAIYSHEALRTAVVAFQKALEQHDLSPNEVAVRWVVHHSALGEQDGVILGASRLSQIEQTLEFIEKGPLDTDLVALAESLWEKAKAVRGDMC